MNDDFTRKVLSEARRSMSPTPEERDAVLKRVMLSAAAATVAGSAAAAAKASGPGGLTAWLLKGGTLLKIGIAVTVAGGAAVAWLMLQAQTDESRITEPSAVSLETIAPAVAPAVFEPQDPGASNPEGAVNRVGAELPEASEETATQSAAGNIPAKKEVPKRRPTAPKDTAESHPSEDGDDALYAEIAVMKKAARALRDNAPERALKMLDAFERSHPNGVMGEERTGLRVLALCAAGPPEKAAAAKSRFLSNHPGSPMAGRIRSACKKGGEND